MGITALFGAERFFFSMGSEVTSAFLVA